jgi:hypothetical protein
LLVAFCVLGFLGASAVGGDASAAGSNDTIPGLPAVNVVIPPISVPAVGTTLTSSTSVSNTVTESASVSISTSSSTSISMSTSNSAYVSTSIEATQGASSAVGGTTTAASGTSVESSLSVSVSGGGSVTGTTISCGASGSKCFGRFEPGTKLTLRARASRGSRFAGWSGGCTGVSRTCLLRLSKGAKVIATFAPLRNAIEVFISKARFDVHWRRSVGSGKLELEGRIGRRAHVTVKLHRAGAAHALLTTHLSLPAGPFRLSVKLPPGSLTDGQPLLPGGFVVSISGRGGKLIVPRQVRAITLSPPR